MQQKWPNYISSLWPVVVVNKTAAIYPLASSLTS